MGRTLAPVLLLLAMVSISVDLPAQTTVTTGGGTATTVPVFTGTATLGNSPISVTGGNVGVGTATPSALF